MTRHVLQILFPFSLFILIRCAQVVPLGGGKRDIIPPLVLESIPANRSTNFNSGVVIIKFDELVQLKDLSGQLIIAPKLNTPPEITAEGKKIVITLKKEELAPNTTYRFYLGRSIADMNESNAVQNFEYVFSTGPVIDTLTVTGKLTDAFNQKPAGNAVVGLYTGQFRNDSLPHLFTPDYLARSNDAGEFSFTNLPGKLYRVYAFGDKNKNNIYDKETEKIAFLDQELRLVSDTVIRLNLFQEESSKYFIKKTFSPYRGLSQVFLSKRAKIKVETLNPADAPNISETFVNREKDTVSIFYKSIADTLKLRLINPVAKKTDTVKIALPKIPSSAKRLKSYNTNVSGGQLLLGEKIKLTFFTWMDTTLYDAAKIRISSKEDSLIALAPAKGRWTSVSAYELDLPLKQGMNYTLRVDTNAFFDTNHLPNDTSTISFKTQSRTEYGKVTLKLRLNAKQDYIIQLINEQELVAKEAFISFSLSSSNAVSLDFIDVLPGTYVVKIIYDNNKNKTWDSGDLLSKQQPEKIIINPKQLKILADWEIEEEILIRE